MRKILIVLALVLAFSPSLVLAQPIMVAWSPPHEKDPDLKPGEAAELLRKKEEFYQWLEDSDCEIAGDACRSCGIVEIINKKYLKDFLILERKAERRAGSCHPACIACDTSSAKIQCKDLRCGQVLNGS